MRVVKSIGNVVLAVLLLAGVTAFLIAAFVFFVALDTLLVLPLVARRT